VLQPFVMAAPPLFRLTLRLHDNDGTPVVRYADEPGRFFQPQSLKLLSGESYLLTVELEDLGKSVEGIRSILLDDEALDILSSEQAQSSASGVTVHTVVCQWKLSRLHFGPTPNQSRDHLPIEVVYGHAGGTRELAFFLQAKMYASEKRRLAKAKDVGKLFMGATCHYDGTKDPQRSDRPPPQGLVASSKVTKTLRWTFEEEVSQVEAAQGAAAAPSAAPPITPRGIRGLLGGR